MTNAPAPTWFSTLIREGLATLYTLSLDGYPAADIVGATTNVWIQSLWNSPRRGWHMEADTPCIRAAFASLVGTSHRWPTPARFWEVLPARAPSEQTALPARVFSLEERRANLRKLKEVGESLFGTKGAGNA